MTEPGGTAVIAEDEYLIALDVQHAATAAGLQVVGTASNGEQAVALVRQHRPSVAILDVQMPRMDGLEAARRIREETGVPVVLMTAYETTEVLERAKAAGVGAYLVKPPEQAELRRAVAIAMARNDDLLELRRLNAELRDALGRVKTLEGILSVCASCKSVRIDAEHWQRIELYMAEHLDVQFSHGLCPDCVRKLYPDLDL